MRLSTFLRLLFTKKARSQYRGQARRKRRLFWARAKHGGHTREQWLQVLNKYKWKCAYCKKKLSIRTATKDHVIPLAKGGSDTIKNIVPACRSCNCRKGTKLLWI